MSRHYQLVWRVICALFFCVLCSTRVAAEDPNKVELSRLSGTWKQTSIDRRGVVQKGDESLSLSIKANGEFAVGTVSSGTCRVDSSKKPKTIDFTYTNALEYEWDGVTVHAIYELDGDKLKVCMKVAGSDRPVAFTPTKVGDQRVIIVYERSKP